MSEDKKTDRLTDISYKLFKVMFEENLAANECLLCLNTLELSIYAKFISEIADRDKRELFKTDIKVLHNKYSNAIFNALEIMG